MLRLVVLFILSITRTVCGDGTRPSDINELFQHNYKPTKIPDHIKNDPAVKIQEVYIDLNKVDPNELLKNVDKFSEKLEKTLGTVPTRRQATQRIHNATYDSWQKLLGKLDNTRRQALHITKATNMGIRDYHILSDIIVKDKILDLWLTFIYLTRHHISDLEKDTYFDHKDGAFRIAFLYRRLETIRKKLFMNYATIRYFRENEFVEYDKKGLGVAKDGLNACIVARRLAIDFKYYFWIMVNLHKKLKNVVGIKYNTTPMRYPPGMPTFPG